MITTRRMTGVSVDVPRRTARVEAGVRWGQVVDEAAKVGLAPLAGSSPQVGVVGYTLGGGVSVALGRAHGYAADHVTAADVVTADGVPRHVTPDSDPDLFFALLGGKGNVGVVTALEFGLFPLTELYAGFLQFAGEHARAVLEAYRSLTATEPDELTSSVVLLHAPDLPFVPEFMRGRLSVFVRVAYLATDAEGEALLAPLRAVAPALVNVTQLGGALGRKPERPNAVRRDVAFAMFALTVVPPGATLDTDVAAELTGRLTRPDSRKHPGYLSPADATVEGVRLAYDEATYARLRAAKSTWDPGNMFRWNHNIPPAA